MNIKIGNIYWITIQSKFAHPHVVIEIDDVAARVCAITTNMKKLHIPGNVLLEVGEGGLEKQSIVEVAKEYIVNTAELTDYIGQLSEKRVGEIIAGISFLQKSYFNK